MNEFLSSIKNQFNSTKQISFLLINTFQIEIIIVMFMGTSLLFFKGLEFISDQNMQNLTTINISILVIHLIVFLTILWQIHETRHKKNTRENIKKLTAQFIKCYKNILMIPAFYIQFASIKNSQNPTEKIIPVIIILIGTFFCYIKQKCCVSYRFRVKNYFKKFQTIVVDLLLIILIIAVDCYEGSHYGAIVMVFKNIFRLSKVYYCFEEPIVQKMQIFYNLYQFMISIMIIAAYFLTYNFQQNLASLITVLVVGSMIIAYTTEIFSFSIYNRMIKSSSLLLMQEEVDNVQDNQERIMQRHFNQIRVMSMIYLQKQKFEQKEENQFEKWWQYFNRKVLIHKMNCVNPKCKCLVKKLPQQDDQIYLKQLINDIRRLSVIFAKDIKLKIMTIYMYIQILRKPLKAYYELIKLKSEKNSDSFDIQLADLSTQTRECFDQLFLKNKVKNQKLQLNKVIEFQDYVEQCETDMKKIITQTMQFYSNFSYNTIKISQITQESNNLQLLKKQLQKKILKILNEYSSNLKVNVLIHLFYNYIEVYQNKETQLKKISNQQLFKKRIFDKKQINVFSPEFGSIFIDLVEQRGKIKNLTKNICQFYGYPKEDMINYNVNLFMPRLFGKHHAKFLHNFIEKGKFRLLKESFRSVFGKNKKKFLFPMKISLKAEYLQQNFFGSSSLLRPIETFSQFIIVDRYGKIEQMTQGVYKKIFMPAFNEQNQKVSRLHVNKLIPSFNVFYQNREEKSMSYDKIIEGCFIYCEDSNYLIEKFKFIKDFSKLNKQLSTNNSNNNFSLSVADFASSVVYTKEQQDINLNDAIKYLLMDLEIFLLKAYKVAYKVAPVVTAEFEAQLIEIVSIQPFINQTLMYQGILDSLTDLLDLFNFQLDDYQIINSHLTKLQSQLESKQYETHNTQSGTFNQPEYVNSYQNIIGLDGPRQVKKITKQILYENQSIEFQDNGLYDQQMDIEQKASINNSSIDNLEGDSKRQILINAFSNSEKKIINSKFSKIAYLAIFVLFGLLVSVLVQSVMYMNLLSQEWRSINHVSQMKNMLQYKKSLIQIDEYYKLASEQDLSKSYELQQSSTIVSEKMQLLNENFKLKIQNIYSSVVQQSQFNQLYTQYFTLTDSVTKQNQTLSFVQLIKEILWRFSYSTSQSISFIRQFYESITQKFTSLQQNQKQFLLEKEDQNIFTLYIINIIYLVLIVLVGLGILPVFFYFKNQQKAMIELLQYISFAELKKSLRKLNQVQSQLNKIDRIDNFDHMKNQIKTKVLLLNKDNINNEKTLNINKSPRIIAPADNKSTSSFARSIFIGILIMVFLSNLSIWAMLQLGYVYTEFEQSVKVNEMIYKLQTKPAMIVNVYLMNVNKILQNMKQVDISSTLQNEISLDYFTPQSLLAQPNNKKITIFDSLFPLIEDSLCLYLEQSCSINPQLTFNDLVYLFKNKFQFLSQSKNPLFASFKSIGNLTTQQNNDRVIKMVDQWMRENQIQDILEKMTEVIDASDIVNNNVYQQYSNKFSVNIYYLIAIGIVFIVLNTIVVLAVQHLTFSHFNSVLKETGNIFRHFDLDTLSENTYLTSYFNAKIKDSK